MKKKENRRDDRVRKRKTGEAKETEKKKKTCLHCFPFRFGHDFHLRPK